MKRLIPSHLRPAALLIGILLSAAVVVLSDSRVVFGTSLILLAAALLAFDGSALAANVEDDSE